MFSPLKAQEGRETRSRHKIRSVVETILSSETKKKPVDDVEQYKSQLKMVFRLMDSKNEGKINEESFFGAMRNLGMNFYLFIFYLFIIYLFILSYLKKTKLDCRKEAKTRKNEKYYG